MVDDSKWLNPLERTHKARKRFGQNFLHDRYVIDQIVSAICPKRDQNLLEIGPGLGALTEQVVKQIDQLFVVELDRDLAKGLEAREDLKGKLKIYQQDALKTDFSEIATQFPMNQKKMRIFGNLPYNISTPLMFHLFQYSQSIEDMYFMLQKEVVQRLVAAPGHKNYGRLSVMAQYYCEMIPVLEVPPEAFRPAPKVNSAIVCLKPYTTIPFQATSLKTLERVCLQAFNMRRKTLRNSLRALFNEEEFKLLNIDSNLRAEDLSVEKYVALANFLNNKNDDI